MTTHGRLEVTEQAFAGPRHTSNYMAFGPEDGPLVVLLHGWPQLSISWRHQLLALGALGFRAVAPDMRGYGKSSVYPRHEHYAQELVVGDMLELLNALDRRAAVWVGHDWGSATVWNLASHHPEVCLGVASLCVPYFSIERGLDHLVALVDRDIYPEAVYPAGQWEYQLFYRERFEDATRAFDANPSAVLRVLLRKGDPDGFGTPAMTAGVRINGGWFGGESVTPDVPLDRAVINEDDLATYTEALTRNGFFGPNSYYMNDQANTAYAASALDDGRLHMPVLFLAARYDYVCETICSRAAEPMRALCTDLDEVVIFSGHWMAEERPIDVNAALVGWLADRFPDLWPASLP